MNSSRRLARSTRLSLTINHQAAERQVCAEGFQGAPRRNPSDGRHDVNCGQLGKDVRDAPPRLARTHIRVQDGSLSAKHMAVSVTLGYVYMLRMCLSGRFLFLARVVCFCFGRAANMNTTNAVSTTTFVDRDQVARAPAGPLLQIYTQGSGVPSPVLRLPLWEVLRPIACVLLHVPPLLHGGFLLPELLYLRLLDFLVCNPFLLIVDALLHLFLRNALRPARVMGQRGPVRGGTGL